MTATFGKSPPGAKPAGKYARQGMAVGKVEIGEPSDRQIEMQGVDAGAKDAAFDTARQRRTDEVDDRPVHRRELPGGGKVAGLMGIGISEYGDELRVLGKI